LATRLNLVELFSSVQGEGIHVGESTLFVRLGGCDLRCAWCDSPGTWRPSANAEIEITRGSGARRTQTNPLAVDDVLEAAQALELSRHRWISLTGGEPLLQARAVADLAAGLRGRGPGIHLETHGLAVAALERVIDVVDFVSMDWKLASDVRRAVDPESGVATPFHATHAEFLAIARTAAGVSIKVVVTPRSDDRELDEMAAHIAAIDPKLPVILQPVTPFGSVRQTPGAARMLALAVRLSRSLEDVRIIPQTHRLYGAP
jgi:7-carboxy-7-deazaguanine synthase